MSLGNVAVDGYGLHLIEVSNVAVGGYGAGIPLIVPLPPIITVIEGRIYMDEERMLLTANRAILELSQRELVSAGRKFAGNSSFQHRADRIYMDICGALPLMDRGLSEHERPMVSS